MAKRVGDGKERGEQEERKEPHMMVDGEEMEEEPTTSEEMAAPPKKRKCTKKLGLPKEWLEAFKVAGANKSPESERRRGANRIQNSNMEEETEETTKPAKSKKATQPPPIYKIMDGIQINTNGTLCNGVIVDISMRRDGRQQYRIRYPGWSEDLDSYVLVGDEEGKLIPGHCDNDVYEEMMGPLESVRWTKAKEEMEKEDN